MESAAEPSAEPAVEPVVFEIEEPENALPPVTLADLPPRLQSAVANVGWSQLMPVQTRAIPYILAGRDLMVQSRTGSGKTGAFLLPILDRIDPKKAECQALILTPTRELAQQVSEEAAILSRDSQIRSVAVYGGTRYGPQLEALKQGAHLVIGTPGRILDHLLRRTLRLDDLALLVFDEADRMLSMGFYPDMREVQRYLPKRLIQAAMFSATFPPPVRRLAQQFLSNPDFLSLSSNQIHVAQADHRYYTAPVVKRDRSLVRLIEVENPTSAIIFCNTKRTVNYVTIVLQRFGYDADELSSDLSQTARDQVLTRLRDGTLRFLVATDVAARGIDVPELSHVFQYEPPDDQEAYIHRAGRTARAGAAGVAITLVDEWEERLQLERIAKRYNVPIEEHPLPTDEDVTAIVSERVTVLLEAKVRARDKLQTERMQRFNPMVADLLQSEEGQSLLAMLVDDFYQESLHTPPDLPGQENLPQRGERAQSRSSSGSSRRGGSSTGPRSGRGDSRGSGPRSNSGGGDGRRRNRGGRSR